jgi:mono/diheme cytochrome c family protein
MGYRKPMKPAITAAAGLVFAATIGSASPARAGGDPAKGRDIAIRHCARCHVIADHNPHGSIGSTASFKSLRRKK